MFYNKLKYIFQTNEQKHPSHHWRFSKRRTFKIQETSKLELSSLKGPGGPVAMVSGLLQLQTTGYLISAVLSSSSSEFPLEELSYEHPKGKGILHSPLPRQKPSAWHQKNSQLNWIKYTCHKWPRKTQFCWTNEKQGSKNTYLNTLCRCVLDYSRFVPPTNPLEVRNSMKSKLHLTDLTTISLLRLWMCSECSNRYQTGKSTSSTPTLY